MKPSGIEFDTLAIVGVGLIGGSIGLAAHRRGLAQHILGVGRNPVNLERARALGIIDEAILDAPAAYGRSDLIVFCTPVDQIAAQVLAAASYCRPGTLLTDAGSTKAAIVHAIDGKLPSGVAFVGSHPLAGSEKTGPEHATADLFQGRLVVVTPTAHSDAKAIPRIAGFWRGLGAPSPPDDPDRP